MSEVVNCMWSNGHDEILKFEEKKFKLSKEFNRPRSLAAFNMKERLERYVVQTFSTQERFAPQTLVNPWDKEGTLIELCQLWQHFISSNLYIALKFMVDNLEKNDKI